MFLATLGGTAFSDEVVPAQGIRASAKIQGDGTRKSPFVFSQGAIGKLSVTGDIAKWNTDDCPPECEIIGSALVFATDVPGEYHTFVEGTAWHAWFHVKGPNGPPIPETENDQITKRVKTALAGNPGDAAKFSAMCVALSKALDAEQVTTLEAMAVKMEAALNATGWPRGKYQDMSKLSGELWGKSVESYPLDAATRTKFADQLRLISKACGEVK